MILKKKLPKRGDSSRFEIYKSNDQQTRADDEIEQELSGSIEKSTGIASRSGSPTALYSGGKKKKKQKKSKLKKPVEPKAVETLRSDDQYSQEEEQELKKYKELMLKL